MTKQEFSSKGQILLWRIGLAAAGVCWCRKVAAGVCWCRKAVTGAGLAATSAELVAASAGKWPPVQEW